MVLAPSLISNACRFKWNKTTFPYKFTTVLVINKSFSAIALVVHSHISHRHIILTFMHSRTRICISKYSHGIWMVDRTKCMYDKWKMVERKPSTISILNGHRHANLFLTKGSIFEVKYEFYIAKIICNGGEGKKRQKDNALVNVHLKRVAWSIRENNILQCSTPAVYSFISLLLLRDYFFVLFCFACVFFYIHFAFILAFCRSNMNDMGMRDEHWACNRIFRMF